MSHDCTVLTLKRFAITFAVEQRAALFTFFFICLHQSR